MQLAQRYKGVITSLIFDNGDNFILEDSGIGFYFVRGKWKEREAIVPDTIAPTDPVEAARLVREADKRLEAYALKNKYITAEEIELPF